MSVTEDLSLLALLANASIPVKAILALLFMVSLASWWVIFRKAFIIADCRHRTEAFERAFWGGAALEVLHQSVVAAQESAGSLERIFSAGQKEFTKLHRQTKVVTSAVMDGTRRAMRATCQRELDYLEQYIAFLATVGGVSPYVGLLGTVWGIMNAFRGLANVQQATLAHVAPGIAEALIATAIGLFAAIPAVVAFNYFSREVDRLATHFDTFMEEYSNILQRQGGVPQA